MTEEDLTPSWTNEARLRPSDFPTLCQACGAFSTRRKCPLVQGGEHDMAQNPAFRPTLNRV